MIYKFIKSALWGTLLAILLTSCGRVPVTGRKQLLLISDEQVLNSSLTQYREYMETAPVSSNREQTNLVKRVGTDIAEATEDYLRDNGLESEIPKLEWEFNLIENEEMNAFCMPGGKIVVYEGLMDIIESEDELAVVLGHEVAHAVAKHSNERISQEIAAEFGAEILASILSENSEIEQVVASSVYGLGAEFGVMLPFSRKHESEADYIGLILMTIAGYNPDVAVSFWEKMAEASEFNLPEFLSTHPSDENRIEKIRNAIPGIRAEYQ